MLKLKRPRHTATVVTDTVSVAAVPVAFHELLAASTLWLLSVNFICNGAHACYPFLEESVICSHSVAYVLGLSF